MVEPAARRHAHDAPLRLNMTHLWLLALLLCVLLRGSTAAPLPAPVPSRLGERRLWLAETDGPEMVVTMVMRACVRRIEQSKSVCRVPESDATSSGCGAEQHRGPLVSWVDAQGLLTVIKEIHRAWDEGGIRLTEEAVPSMHTESSRTRKHNYIAFISFIAGGATVKSYNGVFRSRFACMSRNMVRRGSFGGGDWCVRSRSFAGIVQ